MRRILPFATFALLLPLQLAAQIISAEESGSRRASLVERLGDAPIVVLGGSGAAGENFAYLTGLRNSADAALLLVRERNVVHATLFAPAGNRLERWEGSRWVAAPGGQPELPRQDADQFGAALRTRLPGTSELHLIGGSGGPTSAGSGGMAEQVTAALQAAPGVEIRREGSNTLSDMRAVKSATELALIRRAIEITMEAHRAIAANLRPDMTEADVKRLIDEAYRQHGGDDRPAFGHIVASADNSTILHYSGGERRIADGEHVKIDIGAAYGGYAADVTRTYPANGVFSPEQRAIYQIVREAQAAAQVAARPGASRADMNDEANRVLSEGLTRIGLLQAPDATYDCPSQTNPAVQCAQLRLFYFHALGHGIGLNVHDPWRNSLVPGTAFVIEPGIYVRTNTLELIPDTPRNRQYIEHLRPALDRYLGIGVRIEDSYLVTDAGVEWISRVPRDLADVEAAMARATTPAP
jgi:Xaa-Pro aminopeptidase